MLAIGLTLALALAVAAPPGAVAAEDPQVLSSDQGWQLVRIEDPFAKKSRQCHIRSVTDIEGGRRERPLVIVDLTSRRIEVRPETTFLGAVELNRALQGGRGDSPGRHGVEVEQGLRVDDGEIHAVRTVDDGATTLNAVFEGPDYEALLPAMRSGRVVHYLWAVKTSRKAFTLPLDGLGRLWEQAQEACPGS